MAFTKLHSIYGRILGVSSTFGIVSGAKADGSPGSTAFTMAAQMWGQGMISNISSGGTLVASGVNILSSAAAAVLTYTMPAPVAGVQTEIISDTSSSQITIQTTDVSINFNSSGGTSSTTVTINRAAGTKGESFIVRGLSDTRWQLVSRSASVA